MGRQGKLPFAPWGDRNPEDADPDDWILSFSAEGATEEDRERVYVRLTPRALHVLYVEAKDLSSDARQASHTAECDCCGESVA